MLAQSFIMIREIANRFFATSSPTPISGRRLSPGFGPTEFAALPGPSVKRIDNADVKGGRAEYGPAVRYSVFSAKGHPSRAQLGDFRRRQGQAA